MTIANYSLPPVPWKIRDVIIAAGLIVVSFAAVVLMIRITLAPGIGRDATSLDQGLIEDDPESDLSAIFPWITGAVEGLMLLFVWLLAIRKYRVSWTALGFRNADSRWMLSSESLRKLVTPWRAFLVSYAALPVFAIFIGLIITGLYVRVVMGLGFDFLLPQEIPSELFGNGFTMLVNGALVSVWGPLAEEVFFRGFILAALLPALGAMRAALLTSAIFAAAHVDPGSLVPIFVLGMFLAWLYLRTRSLWVPIIAHMLQNLMAFVATFFV